MNSNPVFILGLDSADFRLCEKWAKQGEMPHFKALMERSQRLRVKNPFGFEAGSLWPCFNMVADVDMHGLHDGFNLFDTDRYNRRRMSLDENQCAYFWERLSQAGYRVMVIDPPYVPLVDNINGRQVVDWMTHVRTGDTWLQTSPSELAVGIREKYGMNPISRSDSSCPCDDNRPETPDELLEMQDGLKDRIRSKTDLITTWLKDERWDYCYCVYHETHDMGHMSWHVHDESHVDHDPVVRAEVGDPLKEIYLALDEAIGRIVEALPTGMAFHLFCSHGMGEERTASVFLDEILLQLELHYRPFRKIRNDWFKKFAKLLGKDPERCRNIISLRYLLMKKLFGADPGIYNDKPHRYFFEVLNNYATGAIRFNLKGRESRGLLDRGSDFDRYCVRLEQDLMQIVNTESGEPLIKRFLRVDEMHDGPMRDLLPDILLEWNKSAPIREIESPLFGKMKLPYRARTGDHTFKTGALYCSGSIDSSELVEHGSVHVKDIVKVLTDPKLYSA